MTNEEAINYGTEWKTMLSRYLDLKLSDENKKKLNDDLDFLATAITALSVNVGAERLRAYNNGYREGYRFGLGMRRDLDGKPEFVKGEWVWVQYDANPEIGNFHCSECHYVPASFCLSATRFNFCPNCGTRMEIPKIKENTNGKDRD